MSLADEVLAKHKLCDGCVTRCGRHCGTCQSFRSNAFPCESVRLATSLRAAEKALREITLRCSCSSWERKFHLNKCTAKIAADALGTEAPIPGSEEFTRMVAEYDKGGQG